MNILRFSCQSLSILAAISYCYLGYVDFIGPFSLGVISIFFLTIIFISLQFTQLKMPMPSIFLLLTIISLIFIWLDLIINGVFRINAIQQFLTPPAIFLCSLGIIYYLNFTKFYLLTFISLILFSSFIALLQGLDFDIAWDIRYAFPASTDIMVENQLRLKEKPSGLSFYAVQFGYQIVFAGCLLMIFNTIYRSSKTEKFVKYAFIFLLASAAIGRNLSPLLSLMVMSFFYFYTQGSYRLKLNHVLIGIVLIFGLIASPIWERIVTLDASMLSRITFLVVGIYLLISNPFGVSIEDTYQAKLDVVNQLFGTGNFPLLEYVLETSFHNSFINIGVQLGWLGFSLYVYLYFRMLRNYYLYIKSLDIMVSRLGSVGFAFLMGYGVQCISHNSGPLTMDPYFWIANGFLLSLILILNNKAHQNDTI